MIEACPDCEPSTTQTDHRSLSSKGTIVPQNSSHSSHAVPPFSLGVCSWSLQVKNIPELKRFLDQLGINIVQIACGDPHHASWDEGDALPSAARSSGIVMTGAMLGFPGEDYTTPQTIKETGGFGNPALRAERIDRLKWALERTIAMGLSDLSLHAGFLPGPGEPARSGILETLAEAGKLAAQRGITLAFETGQETADLLRLTLDELKNPSLKVNFDPANMLLYDMGDPIRAVEILGPDIRSVHMKDARRPAVSGEWGEEVPLGQGEVNISKFIQALKRNGYSGALVIEREVGDQAGRLRDVAQGLDYLRDCLAS
jgi:sugar phosphate isomerase/epimerase